VPRTKQKTIKITDIEIGKRFRTEMSAKGKNLNDGESLEELTASIKEHGLIHPIAVAEKTTGGYKLLAGERRLRALIKLEETEVPVNVFPSNIKEVESRTLELFENIQRKGMTFQEKINIVAEIDRLMKQKYGELPKGLTKLDQKTGELRKEWGTADTAKLLKMNKRDVARDIELDAAMDVFPEVAKAKTKQEAIGKLTAVRAQAGAPLVVSDDPKVQETTKTVKSRIKEIYKHTDFRDLKKTPKADLVVLTETVRDDYLVFLYEEVLKEKGWILYFNPKGSLHLGDAGFIPNKAIWVWQGSAFNDKQVLQHNYQEFWYGMKGLNTQLAKPGHSALFNVRKVPRHLETHELERPIEFYQELFTVFANKNSEIILPFASEGNAILGALNVGVLCVGYGTWKQGIEAFEKKVDVFPPAQYTSYPESIKLEV